MGNHVQSGSARTALDDDATDYYPVALERKALRPGTIYADPYGHVMMVVKWVAQTPAQGGLLLAVDGQPDTSIGRKRFWEGTFLFANDVKSAGPGFKAFRPVARGADGKLAALPNKAIGGAGDPAHAPFSDEQAQAVADAFYARMGKLINPQGLDADGGLPRDARRARRAAHGAGRLRRQRREVPEGEADRHPDARRRRRSSRPPAPGRTTRRRRATCASSSP